MTNTIWGVPNRVVQPHNWWASVLMRRLQRRCYSQVKKWSCGKTHTYEQFHGVSELHLPPCSLGRWLGWSSTFRLAIAITSQMLLAEQGGGRGIYFTTPHTERQLMSFSFNAAVTTQMLLSVKEVKLWQNTHLWTISWCERATLTILQPWTLLGLIFYFLSSNHFSNATGKR